MPIHLYQEKICLMENKGYSHSLEHIADELKRVDVMIRKLYLAVSQRFKNADEYHGLYISDQEIQTLLDQPVGGLSDNDRLVEESEPDSGAHLSSMRSSIDAMMEQSRQSGRPLSLDLLTQRFRLSPFDVDLLLVCLAPELDLSYERIYAYIQDDLTRKKPLVDLALNVVARSFEEKMILRRHLEPGAPLIDCRLIRVQKDPSGTENSFLGRALKVDDRIVSFLLEEDGMDEALDGEVKLLSPARTLDDLVLAPDTRRRLDRAMQVLQSEAQGMVLYFHGPYGVGKKSSAEALCRQLDSLLLVADVKRLLNHRTLDFREALILVLREAVLQNACVFFTSADLLFEDDTAPQLQDFQQGIRRMNGVFFLGGKGPFEPAGGFEGKRFFSLKFDLPSLENRCALWEHMLNGQGKERDMDIEVLAATFAFSGGQIRDALNSAGNLALKRPDGTGVIRERDLYEACRLQSNQKLSGLARKLTPVYTWDDIVLPPDRLEQLREITHHVRYRSLVYGTWGFDRKLSYGKGLHVLFAGPSGTGKTMAAEIMANDLGLDIYKIDLARIVSKYIGETEKNLAHIFDEAETSHAILFFDEADAIFGKRSEVHDAHDRYANIETSYLLQKMEEYEGMTILSTNFRRNMDEAFVRRIQFAVEFPFPGVHDRKRIWEKVWPMETPLDKGIDFNLLARRFDMSGGNIRNISLHAAFIAAADGRQVTMPHLVKATQREYRKMGKLLMGHEFSDMVNG